MADRIYVRGFPTTFTNSELKQRFKEFGRVKKAYVVSATEPKPKLYGIVRFYNPTSAVKARSSLHEVVEDTTKWFIAECKKKSERDQEMASNFRSTLHSYIGRTILIRNFPEEWNENNFLEVFGKYGTINSFKLDGNKAYAKFVEIEEAKSAVDGEKPVMDNGKKLYVTLWQPKNTFSGKIAATKRKRAAKETKILGDQRIEGAVHEKAQVCDDEDVAGDLFA